LFAAIANGERVRFSKVDHRDLVGKFRSEPLDNDLTQGRPLLMRGESLSSEGLSELQKSAIVRVRNESGQIFLEYPPTERVRGLVEAELVLLRQALKGNDTAQSKFQTITRVYRNLMLIHPFLNGNGRAIRLFMDAAYLRIGLPPPVHTFENEFTMSHAEIQSRTLLGMADFLRERRLAQ
jgi:Fic family protein